MFRLRNVLPAGTRAQWDSAAKHVTCLQCVDSVAPPATDPPTSATIPDAPPVPAPPPEPVVPLVDPPPIDTGTPGTSARKEFERRHAKRERQIEETWGTGRLGRIAKFLSDDPQTTTAWAKGAHGEVRVGEILGKRLAEDAVLLHDRKVPKTRGNIDHLAIASSGVWIIDAKKYAGKVEKRDVGGFFKTDLRLYVGGRDRTKSVDGLQWQVDAVRAVLDDDAIPVHPALSFVDAQWPIFAKPLQLRGYGSAGPPSWPTWYFATVRSRLTTSNESPASWRTDSQHIDRRGRPLGRRRPRRGVEVPKESPLALDREQLHQSAHRFGQIGGSERGLSRRSTMPMRPEAFTSTRRGPGVILGVPPGVSLRIAAMAMAAPLQPTCPWGISASEAPPWARGPICRPAPS